MKILAEDKSIGFKVVSTTSFALKSKNTWKNLALVMKNPDAKANFRLDYRGDNVKQFETFCAVLEKTRSSREALLEERKPSRLKLNRLFNKRLGMRQPVQIKVYYAGINFTNDGKPQLCFGMVSDGIALKHVSVKNRINAHFAISVDLINKNVPGVWIELPRNVFLKFRSVCFKALKRLKNKN